MFLPVFPRIQAKVDLGFATMVSQLKHLHAVPRSALKRLEGKDVVSSSRRPYRFPRGFCGLTD